MAFMFLIMMKVSQPALLYLVPCAILPVTILGYLRGNLQTLWNGSTTASAQEGKNREI